MSTGLRRPDIDGSGYRDLVQIVGTPENGVAVTIEVPAFALDVISPVQSHFEPPSPGFNIKGGALFAGGAI